MDSKLIKHKAFKPLLLKDYLLDDPSSCSSNGFKSFPRRQCCTSTVRFLIEIDLNTIKQRKKKSAISAFHSLIAAVKRLPFAAAPSKEKPMLPRSLSKKIFMKSIFWKRKSEHKEISSIQRWKSFDQLLKEDSDQPLDAPNTSIVTISDCGNSSSEVNLNSTVVKRINDVEEQKLNDGDVSGDSTSSSDGGATTEQKQWGVSEEKQQFSPVSVLDCPFRDDEEISSPFQHMEGTTKKLMEKIQRFGNLDQLEPLNLAKRFASDSDDESTGSPPSHSSASEEEEKALDLLHRLKKTLPSYNVKAEKLLLDFFREKTMHSEQGRSFDDDDVLKEADSWINGGEIREPFLGWEVQRNRQAYMNDMERLGEWRCLDQELEGVSLELGDVVFDALFDELLVDISSTITKRV